MTTTYTMRFEEEEKELFSEFAKAQGMPLSQFLKDAAYQIIEDAIDLRDGLFAYEQFQKDPKTISHNDLKKELGLA